MPLEAGLESPDKPELRPWLSLLTRANLVEGQIRRRPRRDFATTLPRFDLLAQLDRGAQGLTLTELSNDNLTGLVERRPDAHGGRRTLVALTEPGKRRFDATMTPAREAWVNGLLEGLSADDIHHPHELPGKLKFAAADDAALDAPA